MNEMFGIFCIFGHVLYQLRYRNLLLSDSKLKLIICRTYLRNMDQDTFNLNYKALRFLMNLNFLYFHILPGIHPFFWLTALPDSIFLSDAHFISSILWRNCHVIVHILPKLSSFEFFVVRVLYLSKLALCDCFHPVF